MKKALALLLAMSLVFSVFAEDVAIELAEFDGSATLEWKYGLDSNKFGFANDSSASLKMNFFSEKEKATEGDGIWGELKIKSAENKDIADAVINVPTASVDTAIIHANIGDVAVDFDIKNHSIGLFDTVLPTAVAHEKKATPINLTDLTAGFTTTVKTSIVDVKFAFEDNGLEVAANKKYGFAGNLTLKPIDGLNVKGGFAMANDKTAIAAGADYKLALNDKMYVKTGVEFALQGKEKAFGLGALFGWGAEEQEPGFFYTADKTADGASVVVTSSDLKSFDILAGVYDSTLVDGLKLGASFAMQTADNTDKTLTADAKYEGSFDVFNYSAKAGTNVVLSGVDTKSNTTQVKFECEVNNKSLIANTDLYAKYGTLVFDAATEKPEAKAKTAKGTITVGAKIHF